LAIIVLTLNKFFVAISLSFTGSPIHPPPLGALRRPPTIAPRSIDLFLWNEFRLQRERRPLAEGPKKHLPFARIANDTDLRDPPNCGALDI
jgi:hypothetical protein